MLPSLPTELREHILKYCSFQDYNALSCCSRDYKEAVKHRVWRILSIPSKSFLDEDLEQDNRLEMLSYADVVCLGVRSSGDANHGQCSQMSPERIRCSKVKPKKEAKERLSSNIAIVLTKSNPKVIHTNFLHVDALVLANLDRLNELYLYWSGVDDSSVKMICCCLPNLQAVGMKGGALTNEGLSSISNLTHLVKLALQNCARVNDDGFAVLASMNKLEELYISGCLGLTRSVFQHFSGLVSLKKLSIPSVHLSITDQEMYHMRTLKSLRDLNAPFHAGISDVGFGYLPGVSNLENLRVYYCDHITDLGLSALSALTSPKHLHLRGFRCPHITNAVFLHLSNLTQLVTLTIDGFHRLTDAGLRYISAILTLKELFLRCRRFSDRGIQYLVGLPNLEKLSIYNSRKVTDHGLSHIADISTLKELQLGVSSKISSTGFSHLCRLNSLEKMVLNNLCGDADAGLQRVDDAGLRQRRFSSSLNELHVSYCNQISMFDLTMISGDRPSLQKLELEACNQFNDDSMSYIGDMRSLKCLNICRNKITDVGIKFLGNLVFLLELDISNNKLVTDLALATIGKLQQLKVLKIGDCCKISDAGLQNLATLSRLIELSLKRCNNVTPIGISHISSLASLEKLNISSLPGVNNFALKCLGSLINLRHLDCSNCGSISNAGLANIGKMCTLTELVLHTNHAITDVGVTYLQSLEYLEFLDIRGCYVTDLSKLSYIPVIKH